MRFVVLSLFVLVGTTLAAPATDVIGDVVDDVVADIKQEIRIIRSAGKVARARIDELLHKDLSDAEKKILQALLKLDEAVQKEVDTIEAGLKEPTKEGVLKLLEHVKAFTQKLDDQIEAYLKNKDLPDVAKELLEYFDELVHQVLKQVDEFEKRLNA